MDEIETDNYSLDLKNIENISLQIEIGILKSLYSQNFLTEQQLKNSIEVLIEKHKK